MSLAECFMCPANETVGLIHRIMVNHGNQTDPVYVCNTCWTIVCESNDSILANMWLAWKEGTSTGYSWLGFALQVEEDLENQRYSYNHGMVEPPHLDDADLYKAAIAAYQTTAGDYAFFFAAVSKCMFAGSQAIVLSRKPIPEHCAREMMKRRAIVRVSPDDPVLHGRWIYLKGDVFQSLDKAAHLHLIHAQALGTADPWQRLASDQTRAGYEMMRRGLV